MVAYHAADLLWATRIKATGQDAGVECRPVRSADMLRARLADSAVRGLIVDLESLEVALELIRTLRAPESEKKVRIVAFGPHVAVEAFEQARAAGADAVLPRGAFDRRLGEILTELDAV
jgi:CheY-like chemotaxis protein